MKKYKWSRDIAPCIRDLGIKWPLYHRERLSAPIKEEVGWNPQRIRTFGRRENSLVPTGIRNPNHAGRDLVAVPTTLPRSSYTSTSTSAANVKRVREIVRSDRRESVHHMASEDGISVGCCHSIPHDVLNIRRVCHYMVTWNLKTQQKETRMNTPGDLIEMADKNKLLNSINTGDGTWCFLYDPQTKSILLNGNNNNNNNNH